MRIGYVVASVCAAATFTAKAVREGDKPHFALIAVLLLAGLGQLADVDVVEGLVPTAIPWISPVVLNPSLRLVPAKCVEQGFVGCEPHVLPTIIVLHLPAQIPPIVHEQGHGGGLMALC